MVKEFGVGDMKEILKRIKMKELENKIEQYRNLIKDLDSFKENIDEIMSLNLDIWVTVANANELKLSPVVIKDSIEKTAGFEHYEVTLESSIPDIGKVRIGNKKGTVIFVDISKSTKFFEEETNYTGFVIFNSYISLVKTYVRLSGGEFLEHTGDGSMLFYEKNVISDYDNCQNLKEDYLKEYPLCMLFYIGYLLQNKAEKKNLLEIKKKNYSLVHIGADYGDVLDVNLGDMRKMISQTVWNAANNCKDAPRDFEKNVFDRFVKLPIKIGDE
jgi:hypothetical protein